MTKIPEGWEIPLKHKFKKNFLLSEYANITIRGAGSKILGKSKLGTPSDPLLD
jgi:hypothetical protein